MNHVKYLLLSSADGPFFLFVDSTVNPSIEYVPDNQLTNLTDKFALRTTESMKKVYDEAQLLNVTEHEQLLKEYGLHNVKVTTLFL